MSNQLITLFLRILGRSANHSVRSILGLAWIIAVIIATSGIITGFAVTLFHLTEQAGYSNHFSIRPIDPNQLIPDRIVKSLSQGDFENILPLAVQKANFSSNGKQLQTNLIGTNLTALTGLFEAARIMEGRLPNVNQTLIECLQGREVSGYLTTNITYLFQNNSLSGRCEIVGTISGIAELQQNIVVHLEDYATMIGESITSLNFNEIKIKTRGSLSLKDVEKELKEILNNNYKEFMVWNEQQADIFTESLIRDILSKLDLLFIVLLIIALSRLFHGISWLVLTYERTFLIMRAIGLSKEKLFFLMMVLGQVVGNIGFLLGIIIGYTLPPLVLSIMTALFGVNFLVTEFPVTSIAPLWLITVLITALATIMPSLKISKTTPAKISILITRG